MPAPSGKPDDNSQGSNPFMSFANTSSSFQPTKKWTSSEDTQTNLFKESASQPSCNEANILSTNQQSTSTPRGLTSQLLTFWDDGSEWWTEDCHLCLVLRLVLRRHLSTHYHEVVDRYLLCQCSVIRSVDSVFAWLSLKEICYKLCIIIRSSNSVLLSTLGSEFVIIICNFEIIK